MQNINSIHELKLAIQSLEEEKSQKAVLLKEQFYLTYESLKPANLIRSALRDVLTTPNLVENFLGTSIGMASGYLSKKIIIGTSGNIFRKFFGSLLDFGVTNVVSQHPEGVTKIIQLLYHKIFDKNEEDTNHQ